MILNVIGDEQSIDLNVPDPLIQEAEDFFANMDRDMDAGWQMSRDWVDRPSREQRCQIAADKLLTALENENRKLAMMMAGYILSRMPGVQSVEVDTSDRSLKAQAKSANLRRARWLLTILGNAPHSIRQL